MNGTTQTLSPTSYTAFATLVASDLAEQGVAFKDLDMYEEAKGDL